MNRVFEFQSNGKVVGTMPHFDDKIIKDEPMFFSCDLGFVERNAGPITNSFLDNLPEDWIASPDLIIDSRVHMLMPSWFPCIPGWHLDDVPRSGVDGQPDHNDPEYKAEHLLCCVGDPSLTLFALGDIRLEEPDPGKVIYGEWHPKVEEMIKNNLLKTWEVPECSLVEFDWRSMHRGQAASKSGWRWFVRVTRKSKRPYHNEIRRQTQVYLTEPNVGW